MEQFPAVRGAWARGIGLLLLLCACAGARADEPADQLDRARLLRELLETRPDSRSGPDASSLPGARIEVDPTRMREAGRRQQFEDTQWRKLLGNQQMQIFAPPTQAIPESQWRAQIFDRERRAEDLSTDILRRSQESLSHGFR